MIQTTDKLPSGWKWVKLGGISEFIRGVSFTSCYQSPSEQDGLIPILRGGNINNKLILDNDLIWVEPENVSQRQFLCEGDIVICMSSGSPDVVGKTAQLNKTWQGSIGAFCGIIRPKEKAIAQYLGYWFSSSSFINWRDNQTRGANIQNLRFSQFEKIDVPIPPLSEQKRIVKILNKHLEAVETARKAAEEQLRTAQALPAAYLRDVFESEEAKKWKRDRLGYHTTKVGSGITPRGGQSTYLTSGVPFIRSQNVLLNSFTEEGLAFISKEQDASMENSRVFEGDVLLNITGASIGRVCNVPSNLCPANVNQHVSIIRTKDSILPEFLTLYLSSPKFQKFIWDNQSGATRQALTKTMIENFVIPLPSIKQQEEIVKKLKQQTERSQKFQKQLENQLNEINAIPSSLLRKAFQGEL